MRHLSIAVGFTGCSLAPRSAADNLDTCHQPQTPAAEGLGIKSFTNASQEPINTAV